MHQLMMGHVRTRTYGARPHSADVPPRVRTCPINSSLHNRNVKTTFFFQEKSRLVFHGTWILNNPSTAVPCNTKFPHTKKKKNILKNTIYACRSRKRKTILIKVNYWHIEYCFLNDQKTHFDFLTLTYIRLTVIPQPSGEVLRPLFMCGYVRSSILLISLKLLDQF